MVITILEAVVAEKDRQLLRDAYDEKTANVGSIGGIHQTFLVQSQSQPSLWRIVTHWRSQEDLDHMRETVETPTGVLIFQAANATPELDIWDVEIHRT